MSNPWEEVTEFLENYDSTSYPTYGSREERNQFAARYIHREIGPGGRALNMGGGGKRFLGKYLGEQWSVTELDITGDVDFKIDLDQIDQLPFEDAQFDLVCAFDVLEHIENIHSITEDMIRVSGKYVLMSLPNSLRDVMSIFKDKRVDIEKRDVRGVYSKYYGLPLTAPQDRHRWWLTIEDIAEYFLVMSKRKSFSVVFFSTLQNSFPKRVLRMILGDRLFFNIFLPELWILLRRS